MARPMQRVDPMRTLVVASMLLGLVACAETPVEDFAGPDRREADSDDDDKKMPNPKTPTRDAGTPPMPGSPSPDGGASSPSDVFKNAGAFTPGAPPTTANEHHLFGIRDMTGRACFDCHNGGKTNSDSLLDQRSEERRVGKECRAGW